MQPSEFYDTFLVTMPHYAFMLNNQEVEESEDETEAADSDSESDDSE
jgi:hypothetical protein